MGKYRSLRNYILGELKNLPASLLYHGLHHTLDVLRVCNQYIIRLKINAIDRERLRVAALMHDYGFLFTYKDHEAKAVEIVRDLLPEYGYSEDDIGVISGLIMATKVPQMPKNDLEKILCDADLDYLGRKDFYPISETLYVELCGQNILKSREQWDHLQVNFLEAHEFHTEFARKYRRPQKRKRIEELKKRL